MDSAPIRHRAYVAYMLRLWQAGSSGGQPAWRASLENPHTGERLAFGDIQALFDFLAELMARLAESGCTPETAERVASDDSDGSCAAGLDSARKAGEGRAR